MKKLKGRRWLAMLMAVLMVIGIMPTDLSLTSASAATTTFEGGVAVNDKESKWDGWTWSVFGGNTCTVDDNTKEVTSIDNTITDNGSSISLATTKNSAGKIQSTAKEGINFLYKKVDKTSNFVLSADVTLDTWSNTSQAAWGVMVRTDVGEHGKNDEAKTLSSIAVGGLGTGKETSYAGWFRKNASDTYSRLTGDSGTQGSTYRVTIKKSGNIITLYKDGVLVDTVTGATAATELDITKVWDSSGDALYVGLFMSRDGKITFSNVEFEEVTENTSVSVNVTSNPTKTIYAVGSSYTDIDMTGFKATATVGGKTRYITADDCTVDKADYFASEGTVNIVLDYLGTKFEIQVTVIKEAVTSIEKTYDPVKTEYYVGDSVDSLDFDGLKGTVTYNSERTAALEELVKNRAESNGIEISVTGADDANTFTSAGTKTVTISYTYGEVTKSVSYDITVSDASVTDIKLSGPNTTTFYKGVTVDTDAYKKGLLVTVNYSDGTKKVLSADATGVTIEAKDSKALDVSTVGKYTYNVTYGGKTATYELEVIERTVLSLEIDTYPTTTTYTKGTEFSADGLVVKAVFDSGEEPEVYLTGTQVEGDNNYFYTIDSSAFNKNTVGEYTIKITASIDGQTLNTSFTVAVKDKVSYSYSDLTWKSIVFGQSSGKATVTVGDDGSVVLEAAEGVGKITDDGQDGIAYYYTELDGTTDNFEITAKVTVDYFITKSSPDNQEGFGIMVRDAIGTDGDASIFYSNAMAVGGYYGSFNVFGRYGIGGQDDVSGKINIVMKGKGGADKVSTPTVYTLTLKKDNSGIYATMKDSSGNVVNGIEDKFYYLPADTFTTQNNTMYVGFFAARGAKIEVNTSSVEMKVTSQSADAPQTFAPEKEVTPSVSQGSLSTTADESYTYIVNVNTKGLLTVKHNGKTLASQQEVKSGSYEFPTSLIVGDNKFQVYFEPDATQNITDSTAVVFNATVTRKVYGATKEAIYASPSGTSTAAGTKADPLDVQTAIDYCQAGQAVYLLPGTYNLTKSTGVWKYNDGTVEDGRKYLMKDPDSTGDVIMDFGGDYSAKKYVSNTFDFSGDYWTVDGIKFANGGGVRVGGNHNIIQNCEFYGHCNSGLQISRTDSATDKADWPSYNQIISCYSYENRDKSDNNADGFAAKLTCGEGNVFRYCVAAYNADDGWDLFSKGTTGAIGAVEIYDCVCFANGYTLASGELVATKGDGNGFKMGGSGITVNHKIYNSISFGNRANGFTNNSDPQGTYVNCIGYNNGGSNLELHVYTDVTPQFTVSGFKSFSDDTVTDIPDMEYTDKEAQSAVISLYYSATNYFRDKAGSEGKSVNSEGKEITAANFANLDKFLTIMQTGIPAIGKNSDGSIDLGGFLDYTPTKETSGTVVKPVTPDGNDADDDYDDDYDDFLDDTVGSVTVSANVAEGGAVSSVTVDSSLKDAVGFTPAEINKINNGTSASVTLDMKDISSSVSNDEKQLISNAIRAINDGYQVGMYFSLDVIKKVGDVSTTVSNLTAPVKISVVLPDSLINTNADITRTYKVLRIHDGAVDTLDASFDSATKQLSFYSDKFSTYAVVYSDLNANGTTSTKSPTTGDTASAAPYAVSILFAMMLIAGYSVKRRRAVK